jgi:phosphatidylglycerophosphate synthase
MSLYVHIIGDNPIKVWGLTSCERKLRVLKQAGMTDIVDDIASLPENSSLLVLNDDYLFDERVINYLLQTPDILLKIPQGSTEILVAAHVAGGQAFDACQAIAKNVIPPSLADLKAETPETMSLSFQRRLRKFEQPFVLPISAENVRILERRLFDWSYKGVTDWVTKCVWPRPARWVVGLCVRCGFRPNLVTFISLLLVILAGLLFTYGWYGWGLLAGWLMTFLDTVDGKLARVTVTSTRFGQHFDHAIDFIHPPIWYILWGVGLGGTQLEDIGISLAAVCWLIVIGYLVGRLTEKLFKVWVGTFGIFCWRPLDSYFRLITARRNPCLIFLTLGAIFGRPDCGLAAVVIWILFSSIFLVVRLGMAIYRRSSDGPIKSWFADIEATNPKQPLSVRLFTQHTTG